jgi:hypothetical protein
MLFLRRRAPDSKVGMLAQKRTPESVETLEAEPPPVALEV